MFVLFMYNVHISFHVELASNNNRFCRFITLSACKLYLPPTLSLPFVFFNDCMPIVVMSYYFIGDSRLLIVCFLGQEMVKIKLSPPLILAIYILIRC